MKIKKFISHSYEIKTGCGVLKAVLKYENNKKQIILQLGKSGTCASSQVNALEKLINLLFDNNVSINDIKQQLTGIQCNVTFMDVTSCADALAKILSEMSIDENLEVNYDK